MTLRRFTASAAMIALCITIAPSAEAKPVKKGAQLTYQASDCVMVAPQSVRPKQRFNASLSFENTGTATWTYAYVGLDSQNPPLNRTWVRRTTRTRGIVRPGQTKDYRFDVIAPKTPGVYDFSWQLRAGRTYFGSVCTQKVYVGVPVPAPEVNTTLTLSTQDIGLNDTIVVNTKDVTLLRFKAEATGEDQLLTKVGVIKWLGDANNFQNYTLLVDTNGDKTVDSTLQSGVLPINDVITFNNLVGGGFVIPANAPVYFEVHADAVSIPQSIALSSISLDLPTTMGAEELSDGEEVDEIVVGNQHAKTYVIVRQGNLYVTKDTTPVRSHQLLAGSLTDSILRLNLRSEYEDVEVTNFVVINGGSTASIDRLEAYLKGSVTPFATSGTCPIGLGENAFCFNMPNGNLVVAEDTDTDVLIRARLKTDQNGAVSSESIQLQLIPLIGFNAVEAEGATSKNTLVQNDGDNVAEGEIVIGRNSAGSDQPIVGSNNYTTFAKITSIVNDDINGDNTAIRTGEGPIGEFALTAATNQNSKNGYNSAVITDLIFTVDATNVEFDPNGFYIYNKSDGAVKSPCNTLDSSVTDATFYVVCWDIDDAGVQSAIGSGDTERFALFADVRNAKVDESMSSSLQVSFDNFSDIFATGMASSMSHVRWGDPDAIDHSRFFGIEFPNTVVPSTLYRD